MYACGAGRGGGQAPLCVLEGGGASSRVRVGIACADGRVRRALAGPECCFCVDSGPEAARLCRELTPDVLALGGALRDADGPSVIARLRAEAPRRMPAVAALGRSGFPCAFRLEAPYSRQALLAAVEVLMDGGGEIPPLCRLAPDCAGRIPAALDRLGVPARLKGRRCLAAALEMILRDGDLAGNLSGRLYPLVGREAGLSPGGAERAMRTAVENAWKRPRYEYFGSLVDPERGMPTLGEFLSQTAENVRIGRFG